MKKINQNKRCKIETKNRKRERERDEKKKKENKGKNELPRRLHHGRSVKRQRIVGT